MVKNISEQFKTKVREHVQDYLQKVEILFFDANGNVTEKKTLGHDRLMSTGLSFSTSTSGADTFDIGAAVIGTAAVTIDNSDDWLSTYDLENARIILYVGLKMDDGTEEYIQKGVYNAENPTTKGRVVNLEVFDNMAAFEKKKLSQVDIVYPTRLGNLLQKVCDACGVILKSNQFTNSNLMVPAPDADITCLDTVGYIAQMACCYAACDSDGKLILKWYDTETLAQCLDGGGFTDYATGSAADGGSFTNYSAGFAVDGGNFGDFDKYHHFYLLKNSPVVYANQTEITGCGIIFEDRETEDEKTLSGGTEGYVITISGNPFIADEPTAAAVLGAVTEKAVGISFRKCSFTAMYDPTVEAGDVGYVSDHRGNSYPIIITNLSARAGGSMSISCDSETAGKNHAASKATTSAKIKEAVKKERSAREAAVQNLAQQLASSSGLFMTTEIQQDGSSIYYMHDKAKLSDSTIIWKLTANALGISTDGGKTYPYGLDVSGTAILNQIYAIGINADYITAGTITGREINNGNGTFKVDPDGKVIADHLYSNSATITGGSININTSSADYGAIQLNYGNYSIKIRPTSAEVTFVDENGDVFDTAMDAAGGFHIIKNNALVAYLGAPGLALGSALLSREKLERLLELI